MTVRKRIAAMAIAGSLCSILQGEAAFAQTTSSAVQIDSAATAASKRAADEAAATAFRKRAQEQYARNPGSPEQAEQRGPFSTTETVVVATWKDGELTNEQVREILEFRKPRALGSLPATAFDTLDRKRQREAIRDLVYEKLVLEEARKVGITDESPEVAKALQEARETILARMFYQREIEPRMKELTEEKAREYYEEKKNELYTQPGRAVVRDVFVPAYKEVSASADDSLTSLAASITGDADAADKILRGEAPYFFRNPGDKVDGADTPSVPLKDGEKLLVPLSEDAVASASEIAKTIKEGLDAGKSIDDALVTAPGDFMVTATGPLNIQGPGYAAEITAAVAKLGDGTSVSDVLKTSSGFHVLRLEEMSTTRVLSFEEVRGTIMGEVAADPQKARAAIESVRAATVGRLWDKFKVEAKEEIINSSDPGNGKPLPLETPVVTAEGLSYTFGDALGDVRLTGKDWQALTPKERLDVVKSSSKVVRYLIMKESQELGLDKVPRFQQEMESKRVIGITESWLEQQRAADAKVNDAILRAYYEDNIEKYTSSSQVTVREISKRINMNQSVSKRAEGIENAKKALLEIRSRIKTQADFEQAARRESEAISTRSRGGLIGTVNTTFRGAPFENQINQLKPGEVSEPFLYGSEVMIIRVDERLAPTPQPFEEVRQRVRQDYLNDVPAKRDQERRETLLKQAEVELKF